MMTLKLNLLVLLLIGLILVGLGWFDQWADAKVLLPSEALQERVKDYVLTSTDLPDTDSELIVEIIQPPPAVSLEGHQINITLHDRRVTPIPYRALIEVVITTECDRTMLHVPVKVSVEKEVWVAKSLIRARTPISAKTVELQRRRLDHNHDYALPKSDDPQAWVAITNLQPGAMLDTRQIKPEPAVRSQQTVSILMKSGGGAAIRFLGKALQDGAVGDTVRVSQTDRDNKTKIYTGRVIKKQHVIVTL